MTGRRIGICILLIVSLIACDGMLSGEGGSDAIASLLPAPARYVYLIDKDDPSNSTKYSKNDIKVYAVFPDGSIQGISLDACTFSPIQFGQVFTRIGLQPITIEYAGKSAAYVVTVTNDANALDLPPDTPGGEGVGIDIWWK